MTQPRPARIKTPEAKPVFNPAIYVRVSTLDQNPELQLRDLLAWFEYMRLPKPTVYTDHGWSGAKISRPQFDNLLKTTLSGGHDLIATWKLDRFGRSTRHLLETIDHLDEAGVRFVSIKDNIDTDNSSPMGRLTLTIMAAFAEFERATMMERVAAGRGVKFAAGQPDSWNLSYGFQSGKPLIKEPEAEIIRHLFRWRDEEYTIYEIKERIKKLAAKLGVKPPSRGGSGTWWPKTLMAWLRSRQYIGEYSRCGELFELPRIIDQDLFERVQAKMDVIYAKYVGNPKNKYQLTGYLWSQCKKPMNGYGTRKGDHLYYRCEGAKRQGSEGFVHCGCHTLRCERIDDVVWREIWRLLQDPRRLRRIAEAKARQLDAGKPAAGRTARERLEDAEDRKTRIGDRYEAKELTREVYVAKITAVKAEIEKLEAEVRAMGKVIAIAPLSTVEAACAELTNISEPEGAEDRREVYAHLLDLTARLEGNEVVITGKLPLGKAIKTGSSEVGNGYQRLTSGNNSFDPIPFTLRAKVAA